VAILTAFGETGAATAPWSAINTATASGGGSKQKRPKLEEKKMGYSVNKKPLLQIVWAKRSRVIKLL
jgi:hypothetical protein